MRNTLKSEAASGNTIFWINEVFGVPYDCYKPKENKAEQIAIEEHPTATEPSGAVLIAPEDIKAIGVILRELANGQLALYKRMNFLVGAVCRIEDFLKGEK